jgi:lipoate-protein ligase B
MIIVRCKPVGLFSGRWVCVDIAALAYEKAWSLQLALLEARQSERLRADVLLLLEHPPVFTTGRRGGREHLLVDEGFLRERGIPLIAVERGGNITYHGPGQLVGYPIIKLRGGVRKVGDLLLGLEEIMIRTLAHWSIKAQRNPLNRGVWVGSEKIGSVGLAVRGGVSFHGFSFNVNVDLEPFGWIQPCGLKGIGVTSMERILGSEIPMQDVRLVLFDHVQQVFGVALQAATLAELSSTAAGGFAWTEGTGAK